MKSHIFKMPKAITVSLNFALGKSYVDLGAHLALNAFNPIPS